MSNSCKWTAKALLDARFHYCGLEHPLLGALYEKALEGLPGQKADGIPGGPAEICRDGFVLPEQPGQPDESGLQELKQIDLMELIRLDGQLPPLPAVLYELQRVVQDETASAAAVAGVVRSDAGLSTFLLRLVNSAFYSFPVRIDTIPRAVSMVGIRPLYMLSMGMLFQDMAKALPKNSINIDEFWRHSIAVGLAAQEIWQAMGYKEGESLFTAGLLHDIGKLALACLLPNSPALRQHILTRSRKLPACEIEHELLGFDHARFGGMLLRKWNMPSTLAMPVFWHHQPHSAAHYKEPVVVHLADIIVTAMGVGAVPGCVVPKLEAGAWEMTGLSEEIVKSIVDVVSSSLQDVCNIFGVHAKM